jgi:hypothetical protein
MQGWYAEHFEREMGCTAAELASWISAASGGRHVESSPGGAEIGIDTGRLLLRWQPLAPRQIALLCMPRLAVSFRFERVEETARQRFMRYFDLYTQRGGG